MHSISVTSHVAANPNTLWNIIGDPARMSDWHPAFASSPVNGSERICTLKDGVQVRETIESVDEDARTYTYSIVESPLPLASYRSTLKVVADGDGSLVTWSADFEPSGASAADVASLVTGIYQAGLAALRGSG